MQICTHKHTDTGEWMCGQAAFISLHSKNRRQCVHSLTCDTKLNLWKILEKAQRIKQSLKSLLCWIKKIMGSRRSGFSTPDRHNSCFISGRQRSIGSNHKGLHINLHVLFFYILVCIKTHAFTHLHSHTHGRSQVCDLWQWKPLKHCSFFSLPILSAPPLPVCISSVLGEKWSRCLGQK